MLITDGLPDNRVATREAALKARAHNIQLVVVGTRGADKDFLASLLPRPELLYWAQHQELEATLQTVGLEL